MNQNIMPFPYEPIVRSEGNRPSVSYGNFYIGSIVDAPFFDRRALSDAELELIVGFEEHIQKIYRNVGPRKYSGLPAYSHILKVGETAFDLASKSDIGLDSIVICTLIGHDAIEDHEKTRKLLEGWRDAVLRENTDEEGQETQAKEQIRKLTGELTNWRKELSDEFTSTLNNLISRLKGVDYHQKEQLRESAKTSVRLIYGLTRFTNQYPYTISMGKQYQRHTTEELSDTLTRAYVKNCDRIANLQEYRPLFPEGLMLSIEQCFFDTSDPYNFGVAAKLYEMFGNMNPNCCEMPNAVKVLTAFNTVFPLHYQNIFDNNYRRDIECSGNANEEGLLALLGKSKNEMIVHSVNLIDSAIVGYEFYPDVLSIVPKVESEIRRKKEGNYYDEITLDGFANKLLLMDIWGNSCLYPFDQTPEGRREFYRIARDLKVLIPKFGKSYNVARNGDPELKSELFTAGRVDVLVDQLRGEKYWQLVHRIPSY